MSAELFVMAGRSVTSTCDKMVKCSIEQLLASIRKPKDNIALQIKSLRNIFVLDKKRYSQLKKQLPFFVCGTFNPPYRKKENFASTQLFTVDIDNIGQKNINIEELKLVLMGDSRLMMMFVSPSGDGLKLIFRLKEPINDSGFYSVFYKKFVTKFSQQYNLEQVTDSVTSDVSRACFISMDANAYFNADATPIDYNDYKSQEIFEPVVENPNSANEKEIKEENPLDKLFSEPKNADPEQDVLDKIKQTLGQFAPKPEKPKVQVPQYLEDFVVELKVFLEKNSITIVDIINISWGKKIKMQVGRKFAEINLFTNKNNNLHPTVCPRSGTDAELNEVIRELIVGYINQ